MLNPRFFAAPEIELEDNDTFEVHWYAQIEDYTLVHWRWGVKGVVDTPGRFSLSHTDGECLYKNIELIAWDWYELNLGNSTKEDDRIRHLSPDPRTRINPNIGSYGLSPAIAAALRSSINQVWFQI